MKITFQRDLLFNTFKQVIKILAKAFIYDNIHSPNFFFFYYFFFYVSQRTEVTFEGQKIIPKGRDAIMENAELSKVYTNIKSVAHLLVTRLRHQACTDHSSL